MEKMNVSQIMKKMIESANGNHHDINHFQKVHSYARTIGICEQLPQREQEILEVAAIVHDIACPLCREKYGSTAGKLQEQEGGWMTREFLADTGLDAEFVERVVYLVSHHHTLTGIEGMDYQILIEADYLVNADESAYSESNIRNMMEKVFKTQTGKDLLCAVYGLQ